MYVCMFVCMYVCMYACLCVYVCIYVCIIRICNYINRRIYARLYVMLYYRRLHLHNFQSFIADQSMMDIGTGTDIRNDRHIHTETNLIISPSMDLSTHVCTHPSVPLPIQTSCWQAEFCARLPTLSLAVKKLVVPYIP